VAGQWFSLGTPVFSTNITDRHDITDILLKVALNTITHEILPDKSGGLWWNGPYKEGTTVLNLCVY
jgi:hypothetical protein